MSKRKLIPWRECGIDYMDDLLACLERYCIESISYFDDVGGCSAYKIIHINEDNELQTTILFPDR